MTLPHPAGRCRAISLLLPLCLRGKRSAPSDEHFVPADGSPCGRSNGEEPGYAAKVWPPGVGRYPWVQESSQITGASLAEFILQQLSKPELLRQIRCTRSSSIETTSWQETSCGRLGRTNVTRAVGDETRTGLSLAPSSVEQQPAQCRAHFCGMADYSTVRLTVPPYAVRAFSLPALPREHANAYTTYRSTDYSTRLFRKRTRKTAWYIRSVQTTFRKQAQTSTVRIYPRSDGRVSIVGRDENGRRTTSLIGHRLLDKPGSALNKAFFLKSSILAG